MQISLILNLFVANILALWLVSTATASEAATNQFFAVNPVFNSRTYIEEWGDPADPPVILVHGLGDNGAKDWRYLAPALADNFYVIAFDLPGFGRSEKNNELYTPDNYAKVLDWIADTYAHKPFALIGHSMGAAIALNYAAEHSDHLSHLILIDAAGILHRTAFTKHLIDDLKLPGFKDKAPIYNLEALNALLGINLDDLDRYPARLDFLLLSPFVRSTLLGGDPKKIAGLALVQHNFSGKLRQVSVPTLVIWGAEDNVAPLRTGYLLANRLPKARLKIIQGAQHTPMIKNAAQLNQMVLNELNGSTDNNLNEAVEPIFTDTKESIACSSKNNQRISGRYALVTIENCKRLLIEDSKIDRLIIHNSSVEIINSVVSGSEVAMEIDNSMLNATATDFIADLPIIVSDSHLDFAGVRIIAGKEPFQIGTQSTVLFSVSNVRSPKYSKHVHGVFHLSHDNNSF
jgi:pimeloyl-ACP methyl ester carboxylesterase